MQMCELSLEETGLNRKKGAEILEHDFDKEWLKHGGKPYVRPSQRGKWNCSVQWSDLNKNFTIIISNNDI